MTLSAGSRLGPYEIVAALGAGGMGEVYRAKDPRLGREVAVKVLPASFSDDPDRLRRFEQEARAAGLLNHPNITSVFDVGSHEGAPYVVTELLEGETLRSRLAAGALVPRKALDYAIQIARGLAAAHEKGIVHRDLKPENVFVTDDGRVKILDFGLAKLKQMGAGTEPETNLPTGTLGTEPGVVLGTMGYMSPEQVRGKPADSRSDIFSFGAILYEMLSGRRAFHADTAADTITAILTKEPADLSQTNREIHPGLDRIVRHCLEKNPQERFQSARDVAFDLEALSAGSAVAVPTAVTAAPARPRRWIFAAAVAIAIVAATLAGFAARSFLGRTESPRFRKLTFQRGTIYSARLAPDGQTVLYGAAWGGAGIQLYSTRSDARESRPLGIAADVLGISPSGEMALSLGRKPVTSLLSVGRLGRAPLAGGAPREVLDGVVDADWSRDGKALALTREFGGEARLEYPIGRALHKAGGYLSSPRISPPGDGVAFIQHQIKGDDRGSVAFVDRAGRVRTLTGDLPSVTGLSWSPEGNEVWFSAWIGDRGYSIEAVTPSGRRRTVTRLGSRVKLYDVLGTRALVGLESGRAGTSGLLRGDSKERDLSWLDGTFAADLSESGDQLLFGEGWEGGGASYSLFLRKAGGGDPVRLGEGFPADISADGRWIISYPPHQPVRLVLVPAGIGESKTLELPGFDAVAGAEWFPDGRRILLWANETGRAARGYVLNLTGGRPRPVTPPDVFPRWVSHGLSPDGRSIAALDPAGNAFLYPVEAGADPRPRPIPGILAGEEPVRWTADGRELFVRKRIELPNRVYRLDVTTGRRELSRELMPADPDGVSEVLCVVLTPDGRNYAYSYLRILTELYLVEGLK
jgi:dipeptidyl aminopeptidase/acylaminoacyl peptidase